MLLPALSKARQRANAIFCLSNLKQHAVTTDSYAADVQYYPPYYTTNGAVTWYTILFNTGYYSFRWGTTNLPGIFRCPDSNYINASSPGQLRQWGYGINFYGFSTFRLLSQIKKTTKLSLYLDGVFVSSDPPYYVTPFGDANKGAYPEYRHSGYANVIFVYCHAESRKNLPDSTKINHEFWKYNF